MKCDWKSDGNGSRGGCSNDKLGIYYQILVTGAPVNYELDHQAIESCRLFDCWFDFR